MDQNEIVRRLCNGALAQILHESNNNNSSNNESILNTLLINTISNLFLKRKTNKSTQTDFNVQRKNCKWLESQHLLPLCKLKPIQNSNPVPSTSGTSVPLVVPVSTLNSTSTSTSTPRKNCIR